MRFFRVRSRTLKGRQKDLGGADKGRSPIRRWILAKHDQPPSPTPPRGI